MSNRLKLKDGLTFLLATVSRPKPGDFPVGSSQSRAAARARLKSYNDLQHLEELAELGDLSPLEQAFLEGSEEETAVKIRAVHFLRIGLEIDRLFGFRSPTAEEVRHGKKVLAAIDEMTDGQEKELSNSNPAEWRRLKEIVEEKLKNEDQFSPCKSEHS